MVKEYAAFQRQGIADRSFWIFLDLGMRGCELLQRELKLPVWLLELGPSGSF